MTPGTAEHEISIVLTTVFLLSAATLFLFSAVGHALVLDPTRFDTRPRSRPTSRARASSALQPAGLLVALFLVGAAGLARAALKSVGARPLRHGLALWIAMGTGTLSLVLAGCTGDVREGAPPTHRTLPSFEGSSLARPPR